MTDSKLRELERRWKESQSVEDEAAYLLERVRVGDLEREKLELAAYCGQPGAERACESLGIEIQGDCNAPGAFYTGLAQFPPRAAVRVCLATLRVSMRNPAWPVDMGTALLEVVNDWLAGHGSEEEMTSVIQEATEEASCQPRGALAVAGASNTETAVGLTARAGQVALFALRKEAKLETASPGGVMPIVGRLASMFHSDDAGTVTAIREQLIFDLLTDGIRVESSPWLMGSSQ